MGTGINRGVVEKARHYQMYTYAPFSFLFFFLKNHQFITRGSVADRDLFYSLLV